MPDYRPPPKTKPRSTTNTRPTRRGNIGWIQHERNTTTPAFSQVVNHPSQNTPPTLMN